MPEKMAMNMRPIPISTAGLIQGFSKTDQEAPPASFCSRSSNSSTTCSGSWTPRRQSIRKLALRRCRLIS